MFGSLLSTAIKTVTLPVDAANASLDVMTGGDGSKVSRTDIPLFGDIEKVRDRITEAASEVDE